MKRSHRSRAFIPLVVFLALPAYFTPARSCGASSSPEASSQPDALGRVKGKGKVNDLRSIEPLKQAFQRDSGKIRLVALVSPT
jgi:hypothetical protein